ncbi:hypothetical protein, partial [Klebsiella pneumoniae]
SFKDKDILFIANKKSESEAIFIIKNKSDLKINDLQQLYYFIQLEILKDCKSEINCAARFKSIIQRHKDLDYKPKDFQIFSL